MASRSWWCPGLQPSLTMMATPENMTAETSCQTLHRRENRGPRVSTGVSLSPLLHNALPAVRVVISLCPPSSPNCGSRGSSA